MGNNYVPRRMGELIQKSKNPIQARPRTPWANSHQEIPKAMERTIALLPLLFIFRFPLPIGIYLNRIHVIHSRLSSNI